MAAVDSKGAGEDMPGYIRCATDIYVSIRDFLYKSESDVPLSRYPIKFYEDLAIYSQITQENVIVICVLAILLTVARYIVSYYVFLPIGTRLKMTPLNTAKFPESAWKSIFYASTWAYSFYLLIWSGRYDYFQRPLHIWEDYRIDLEVPFEISAFYAVQFAFYLHSVYGTLYMDQWRKDSVVMVFHHFLTMALIGFSFAVRCHKIGILVLLFHDIADLCLEFTKCNVYLKTRDGKYYAIHDHISTVGFLCFASSWFIFRLYLFPLKVLHSTAYGVVQYGPSPTVPFYFFFNVQLWILLILNIYWFMFIVNFLYRVATGQMKEVDDVREVEVDEKLELEKKLHTSSKVAVNGNSSEAVANGVPCNSFSNSVNHHTKAE